MCSGRYRCETGVNVARTVRGTGGETQDDFAAVCFSPPAPPPSCLSQSSLPTSHSPSLRPSPPGFLDAEQTQCSLCKITRLINANKQTAQRRPQMKANLYTINRGRSSFNLPMRPARCCSTPPPSFTSVLCLFCPPRFPSAPRLLPPLACVLPISALAVLLGWAQRQGKLTDASIIHRSPPLSLSFLFSPSPSTSLPPLCSALCIFRPISIFRE